MAQRDFAETDARPFSASWLGFANKLDFAKFTIPKFKWLFQVAALQVSFTWARSHTARTPRPAKIRPLSCPRTWGA